MGNGEPPTAFEFYIGGSVGPSLYVRLVDGQLLHEWASAGGYSGVVMEASPTPEEWGRFRETIDRLGIREWEPDTSPRTPAATSPTGTSGWRRAG